MSRKTAPALEKIPRAAPGDYPLTHVQRRVWAFEQMSPGTTAYNVTWVKSLHGTIDFDALEQAFTALVNRHAMMRATFHATPEGPIQRISPLVAKAEVRRIEAQSRPREAAAEDAARVFDLERGPVARASLLRVAEDEHWLLLVMHHLVSDGWTMGIVERELAELYQAFCEKREANLAPVEVDYPDFAAWQAARAPEVAYWVDEVKGAPPELGLQADFARPARSDPAAWVARLPVSDQLLAALERAARRCDATLYSLLIAAWAAVLHRYGCGEELMIGTPLVGRNRPELAGMAGFLANTLPLRISVHGDPSFFELVARVKDKVLGAIEHQDGAFDVAVEQAKGARVAGVSPGFQTAVAYLESPPTPLRFGALRTGYVGCDNRAAQFDVMVFADQYGGQLELSVALRKQIFRESTATAMVRHFGRILEAVAEDPMRPISHYPLLDREERQAVMAMGAGPDRSLPREPVHVLFEQQKERTPDAVALVGWDGGVTYAELSRMSNRVAAAVAEAGAGVGSIAGVLCDGSAAMVAAFLGVMKAGAAYLPLDASDPHARLSLLLTEARATLVLGEQHFSGVKTLPLTGLPGGDAAAALPSVTPDSPAYAMYTSGSTGAPKAVLVPHRGIVRLVRESGFARLDSSRTFLHMAPPAFDASTFEIWAPLLNGGRAVLYSGRRAAIAEIGEAIRRHGVTTLWLTSSLFNAVIDEAPEILVPVRQLLTGGEALSVRHVIKALRALPETEIINGYGPTECTTFACCHSIPRDLDPNSASVPIGAPIGNTFAYILDERGEPVPVGVPGELYLGGDGVALGYLHRPDLTAAAFLPDPFRGGDHRMYRTGDRARWLPPGSIEFLGRADGQIKIRGFRIEPGEVEAALQAVPGVGQCAVAAVTDASGAKQLAAWVVPADAAHCDAESLRAELGTRLPAYMVPTRIALAERLPLRENGKLDRALLPAIEPRHEAPAAPVDEFEAGLLELWQEILGVSEAGVCDDFFRLGGDSLRAIRLTARIERRFGQSLPVATVVSASTVRKLAAILRAPQQGQGFVAVTTGNSGWPLVWLDPGRSLQHLATGLGPDQPLHSLTLTPAEVAALPTPYRVDDMAALLADKLEQWRPGGPTVVASFCLRTFLAVETARVLRKRGHDVPLVILADPSNPDTAQYLDNPVAPASLAWRAGVHLRRLRTIPVEQWGSLFVHLVRSLLNLVKGRQPRAETRFGLPIRAAGARHRLEPYDGPLLLVRIAPQDRLEDDEIIRGWSRVAAGRLSVRALSGGHVDLFDPPHAFALAQMIGEEMAAVRQQHRSAGK